MRAAAGVPRCPKCGALGGEATRCASAKLTAQPGMSKGAPGGPQSQKKADGGLWARMPRTQRGEKEAEEDPERGWA